MIWLLLCLAVIGVAWFMFVPRVGKNETLIPVGSPTDDRPPARAAEGEEVLIEEAHPAHSYETSVHATGPYRDGHQPFGTADFNAYVASTDVADAPTAFEAALDAAYTGSDRDAAPDGPAAAGLQDDLSQD